MLLLRTLIGRLERRLATWYGLKCDPGCPRCHRPNVTLHVTPITLGWFMEALCEPCWRELAPDARLPFYEPVIQTMTTPRQQYAARQAVLFEKGH